MAHSLTSPAPPHEAQQWTEKARAWPTLMVFAALWLVTINQLRIEWSINPQYTYGWTVPFLALYLFAERWKNRPPAGIIRFAGALTFLVLVGGASWLPLRLIQEASPDWRLVGWAMASVATGLSLGAVYYAGGFPWLRHFAVPILFFLVAVPWPTPFESALIQGLMRIVARVCVESLSFFAIPAIQHGNLIEISTGRVGVEEACSGVRSLQTTLMAAIFLGELFRFTVVRRVLLLVSGLLLAFVCNLGRSFYLVWVSVHEGTGAAMKIHDTVGLSVLIGSLAGLAGLCALLRPRFSGEEESNPSVRAAPAWQPRFAPRAVLIAAGCWLLVVEVGTELWYRAHEVGRVFQPWSLRWPETQPGFRDLPLGEAVRTMLRYDEGRSAVWTGDADRQWSMIFLRWKPGRTSIQLARSHGPEICLPATGAVMREDLGVKPMRVAGLDLPMHRYLFAVRDAPLYIFYCLWEDAGAHEGPESTLEEMTPARRLRAVREGRRNLGQQIIEVAVAGPRTAEEAEAATAELLDGLIVP